MSEIGKPIREWDIVEEPSVIPQRLPEPRREQEKSNPTPVHSPQPQRVPVGVP